MTTRPRGTGRLPGRRERLADHQAPCLGGDVMDQGAYATAFVVAAQENSADTRRQAISAGLRAARIASAAKRTRKGLKLGEIDRGTIRDVVANLRSEARILRDPTEADLGDDSSFSFVGLTLSVLPEVNTLSFLPEVNKDHDQDPQFLVDILGTLATTLESMLSEDPPSGEVLELIQAVFTRASDLVGSQLGSSGEIIDGEIEGIR
jgi:hypothetical protein